MELTTIQQSITIIAGSIAIVTGFATFFKWLIKKRNLALLKVYEKGGDIFGVFSNNPDKQLTFSGQYVNPVYAKKKSRVIFLRWYEQVISRKRKYRRYSIISMNAKTLLETVLTDQKLFMDGLDASFELFEIKNPTLSSNHSKLYFITEKYATASELMCIDVTSGKSEELFSAEHFDFVKRGRFKGKFLVAISAIVDNKGRDIHYRVYNKRGKTLEKFESEEEYKEFRGKYV